MKYINLNSRFCKFVKKENLFSKNNQVLLAISGGVDSVVLAHLLKEENISFGLAHCNFKLRGKESDEDEKFVAELAEKYSVPFFSTHFNTIEIAASKKNSIQVAARELRYEWLNMVLTTEGYDFLATAHHLNDSIETVILNLSKGCGIRGLHGILPKNDQNRIIRPLMFANKDEILSYANEKGLDFRTDSSNESLKYSRNLIRHQVLPILKKLNPSLEQTFQQNFQNFKEAEELFLYAINKLSTALNEADTDAEIIKIDTKKLSNTPAPSTVLFEMLSPYGFNNDQLNQIIDQIDNTESANYESDKYLLSRNYGKLILKLKENENEACEILIINDLRDLPIIKENIFGKKLQIELLNNLHNISQVPLVAFFDADKLKMPLKIRFWKKADRFQPKGMGGKHKKLSSFFKDLKLNEQDRKKLPLFCSGDEIAWVIGYRTSEKFNIDSNSLNILKITYL